MLARIVTGDESWVRHYQPRQSVPQCSENIRRHLPKNVDVTPFSRKAMLTVFWDHEGILFTAF
jgi:hypothetical protein